MKLTWAPEAEADLENLLQYVARDSVRAALDIEDRVTAAATRLLEMPMSGRPGRLVGTRELVVPRTPYLIVYRVQDHGIGVARVMHGRQDWPPHG